ncbi:hypothetical protein LTR66_006356 [Elasticomyces elasticus]|nr:hypothetical protein LTR66_006356 [Elasticomyces elasticus]
MDPQILEGYRPGSGRSNRRYPIGHLCVEHEAEAAQTLKMEATSADTTTQARLPPENVTDLIDEAPENGRDFISQDAQPHPGSSRDHVTPTVGDQGLPDVNHMQSSLGIAPVVPSTAIANDDTLALHAATMIDDKSLLASHGFATLEEPTMGISANMDLIQYDASFPFPEYLEPEPQTQAYAMLKFPDGDFFITTLKVELGRDLNAARLERKHERRLQKQARRRQQQEPGSAEADCSSGSSGRAMHKDVTAVSCSNVSDCGGILGYDNASDSDEGSELTSRKRRRMFQSTTPSSHSVAPASLHLNATDLDGIAYNGSNNITDYSYADSDPECPLVPIHPRQDLGEPVPMGRISRRHVRIEYNLQNEIWELHVIGRNGAALDGKMYTPGEVAQLHDGSYIEISNLHIKFKLPDLVCEDQSPDIEGSPAVVESMSVLSRTPSAFVADGLSDASSDTMNDDAGPEAEDSADELVSSKSSEPEPDTTPQKPTERPKKAVKVTLKVKKMNKPEKVSEGRRKGESAPKKAKETVKKPQTAAKKVVEPEPQEEGMPGTSKTPAESETPDAVQSVEKDATKEDSRPVVIAPDSILAGLAPEELPQKRKGPGRPPKNGLVSKRHEAAIKRYQKMCQKEGRDLLPFNEILEIVKAEEKNQPPKDPDAKSAIQAKPVKAGTGPSGGTALSVTPTVEAKKEAAEDKDGAAGEKKASRSRRMSNPPSPIKPEAECTEEELQKPPENYVHLLHKLLKEHEDEGNDGGMELQEIYHAMTKKWPYFQYRSGSNGWQSSIRHNLIGSTVFKEAGKSGKGRLWMVNPDAPPDALRKRRRESPPPQKPQHTYPPQYPNYPVGHYPYANGYTPYAPLGSQPNTARPPTVTAPSRQTYNSPYASQPPGQTQAPYSGPPRYPQQMASGAPPNLHRPPPIYHAYGHANSARPPTYSNPNRPSSVGPNQPLHNSSQSVNGQQPVRHDTKTDTMIDDIMKYGRDYAQRFPAAEHDQHYEVFRRVVRNQKVVGATQDSEELNEEEALIAREVRAIISKYQGQPPAASLAPQVVGNGLSSTGPQGTPPPMGGMAAIAGPSVTPQHASPHVAEGLAQVLQKATNSNAPPAEASSGANVAVAQPRLASVSSQPPASDLQSTAKAMQPTTDLQQPAVELPQPASAMRQSTAAGSLPMRTTTITQSDSSTAPGMNPVPTVPSEQPATVASTSTTNTLPVTARPPSVEPLTPSAFDSVPTHAGVKRSIGDETQLPPNKRQKSE